MTLALSGCLPQRDFADRSQRPTARTAYTIPKDQIRVDAGLVGTDVHDAGLSASVHEGINDHLEVGANLAHAVLGVVNLDAKVAVFERPKAALGLRAGVLWTNSSFLWALPRELRQGLGDINVVTAPLLATATFPTTRWLNLHLGMGYTHIGMGGVFEVESALIKGGLAARDFFFEPQATFLLADRVALSTRLHLSAWAAAQLGATAYQQLGPGVQAGIASAEWVRIPFSYTHRYSVSADMRLGRTTYASFAATLGRFGPITPVFVWPSANVYWRF